MPPSLPLLAVPRADHGNVPTNSRAHLPADLKQALSQPSSDAPTLQKPSVTALLTKLSTGADPELATKLASLVTQAKKLGLDEPTA